MQLITYTTRNWLRTPLVLLVAISTILMFTGAYVIFTTSKANAAALTTISDVLTVPTPSSNSDHTVTFTLTSGLSNGGSDTIVVEWDTLGTTDQFDFTSLVIGDVDISGSAVDQSIAASCAGSELVGLVIDTSGDKLTFTICTESGATDFDAGSVVEIQVGTNAASGTNQINNPAKVATVGTADIYDIAITATGSSTDTGSAYVAVIEGVAVSVTVAESLAFAIAGVASGSCTGDTGTGPIAVTTTATTVPFGTIINVNQFYVGCQLLTVSTNATNGYSVTAVSDTGLDNGSNNISNGVCDASCTSATGDTWATDTQNGFGYYCEEGTNTPCDNAGDATTEYRTFACAGANLDCEPVDSESPVTVMTEAGTASSSTGTIHYKLNIDPTQTTGVTYSNTVTYVATGTF